jgi:hypothetical protein
MKKELVMSGQEHLDAVKAVQSLDVAKQRLKFMTNNIGPYKLGKGNREFTYTKMWVKEDKVYYASDTYRLFMSASGKLFTRSNNVQGFTYEPLNKHTFKLWGKTKLSYISHEAINELLINSGNEWALEEGLLYFWRHKGIFQRILKGRITNGEDLVRAFLKVDTRWRELKISHRAKSILTLMRRNLNQMHCNTGMSDIIDFLSIVSNVEGTIDMMLNGKGLGSTPVRDANGKYVLDGDHNHIYEADFQWFTLKDHTQHDMRNELVILGKKINSTWSANRLKDEHTEMSRQVLDMEVEDMVLEDHGYEKTCPVLPGMELIDNNIRLYKEGRTMEHCIFSYLNNAKERRNFHFHCTFGAKPFSLSVQWSRDAQEWNVQQMHTKYNGSCNESQRVIAKTWLEEEAVQAWFTHEFSLMNGMTLPKPYGL